MDLNIKPNYKTLGGKKRPCLGSWSGQRILRLHTKSTVHKRKTCQTVPSQNLKFLLCEKPY